MSQNQTESPFFTRDDRVAFLATLPVFKTFNSSELLNICNIAEYRTLEAGQYLVQEGHSSKEVQIILSGEVVINKLGVCVTPMRIGKGNLIGEVSFFSGRPYLGTPIAQTQVELCVLSHETLRNLVKEDLCLGIKIYRSFTLEIIDKLTKSFDQVTELVHSDPSTQVAHDIRSPVFALKAISSKLSDGKTKEKELLDLAIDRIVRIADSLLSSQSASSFASDLGSRSFGQISVMALDQMLRNLINEKRIQSGTSSGAKEIRFTSSLSSSDFDRLLLRINPTELERVISNLIDNSFQAIQFQGQVEIFLIATENGMSIRVKDNGVGIPQDVMEKLGRFKITFGKEQGSGLGLLHAYRRIESWGGSIQIQSTQYKGSEVTLFLPVS